MLFEDHLCPQPYRLLCYNRTEGGLFGGRVLKGMSSRDDIYYKLDKHTCVLHRSAPAVDSCFARRHCPSGSQPAHLHPPTLLDTAPFVAGISCANARCRSATMIAAPSPRGRGRNHRRRGRGNCREGNCREGMPHAQDVRLGNRHQRPSSPLHCWWLPDTQGPTRATRLFLEPGRPASSHTQNRGANTVGLGDAASRPRDS